MTTKMHDALINEIAFIFDVLEHEDIRSLELINTIDEAKAQVEGYMGDYNEDLPEGLTDPETMMMVWNYCIEKLRKEAEDRRIQEEDDRFAQLLPNTIRFRKAFEDGSSCFFDPDQLSYDLMRTGYDEIHREIIAKALTAYVKTWDK